jgi:hypothetical protein
MAYQKPKKILPPVPPPTVEGEPASYGMKVVHEKYGKGTLQWAEWRNREDYAWVPPLERDPDTGMWVGIVSQAFGSYMAELDNLRLL